MKLFTKILNSVVSFRSLVFLDQAMVSGCNFLLGILLVRAIGLAEYGVFTLIWMAVFFALGINQAFIIKPLLSIAPKLKSQEKNNYLTSLHAIQYFIGALFLLIGLGVYGIVELLFVDHPWNYIPWVSMIIFCQIIHDFYRKVYLIKDQIIQVCLIDFLLYGGQISGISILLLFGELSLMTTLYTILSVNILSILLGKSTLVFSLINYKKILIRHFHFSKWLLGTSVLQWLSGNYFIIVGASILGTSAVGAIRMVQNLMGLCHILFLVMESVIPIEAARQFQAEGEDGLIQYLFKTTKQLGVGFGLLLAMIALFAAPILSFFYGAEAGQFAYIAMAYALLYALVFLGHPLRFYLRTIEKTSPIFFAYCFGALFSLCSAYPLLNYFEIYGLLFGLIFTQIINLLTYYFFSNRFNKRIDFILK